MVLWSKALTYGNYSPRKKGGANQRSDYGPEFPENKESCQHTGSKADSVYPKQDKHKEDHYLKYRIVQPLKNKHKEKSYKQLGIGVGTRKHVPCRTPSMN